MRTTRVHAGGQIQPRHEATEHKTQLMELQTHEQELTYEPVTHRKSHQSSLYHP